MLVAAQVTTAKSQKRPNAAERRNGSANVLCMYTEAHYSAIKRDKDESSVRKYKRCETIINTK